MASQVMELLKETAILYVIMCCICLVFSIFLRIVNRLMHPIVRECQALTDNGQKYFYYEKNGEPVIIKAKSSWFSHCGQTVKARVSVVREGYVPSPFYYSFINALAVGAFLNVAASFLSPVVKEPESPIFVVKIIMSFMFIGIGIVVDQLIKFIIYSGSALSVPICEEVRDSNNVKQYRSQETGEVEVEEGPKKYVLYYPIQYNGQDMLLGGDITSEQINTMMPTIVRYNKKNPGAFITLTDLLGSLKVGLIFVLGGGIITAFMLFMVQNFS